LHIGTNESKKYFATGLQTDRTIVNISSPQFPGLIDDTSKIAKSDKKDHIQLFEEIKKRIVDNSKPCDTKTGGCMDSINLTLSINSPME